MAITRRGSCSPSFEPSPWPRLALFLSPRPQVKTLYYITYHLRQFTDIMQPYRDSITVSVIQLLMNCPNESVGS